MHYSPPLHKVVRVPEYKRRDFRLPLDKSSLSKSAEIPAEQQARKFCKCTQATEFLQQPSFRAFGSASTVQEAWSSEGVQTDPQHSWDSKLECWRLSLQE